MIAALAGSVAALVAGAACGETPETGADDASIPEDAAPPTPQDELFSLHAVTEIWIELSDESYAALRASPDEYVRGVFRAGDVILEDVAIRLKGGTSFEPLGRKASFKISFDKLVSAQRFVELRGITLNNMMQDRSMTHEWLAYQVFCAVGVAAARTGFATVHVNDEYYGLYLIVENSDYDFLSRHYENPNGNLYEGSNGADFRSSRIGAFELDEGVDLDRRDLIALVDDIEARGLETLYGPDPVFDRERVLAYLAAEAVVGHFDGYRAGRNYRVYREPDSGLWSLLPWGLDQSMIQSVSPFTRGQTVLPLDGQRVLHQLCYESAMCRMDVVSTAAHAVDAFEALDLASSTFEAVDLTANAASADTWKPYSETLRFWALWDLAQFIHGRPDELRRMLDCEDQGVEYDRDSDGAGACTADCDDTDATVHVGAPELCDGIDNDCNGFVDDSLSCPCTAEQILGRDFLFCVRSSTADAAAAHCAALGMQLASFDDIEQNEEVFLATQRRAYSAWWFGLNDSEAEGQYRWRDGGEPAFYHWHWDEPGGGATNKDCVSMKLYGSGTWRIDDCETRLPFVCSDGVSVGTADAGVQADGGALDGGT